jgi:MutS domain V
MKAYLMFKDRDFDPRQVVAKREDEHRPSYRNQSHDLRQLLPWNEGALVQDLGLEIVFEAMSSGDIFLSEVARVALLSSLDNPESIRYRQSVLRDCIDNEDVVRQIYAISVEAIEGERKNYWSVFGRYPSGTLSRAVDVLQMFVRVLKRLRHLCDEAAPSFHSEGFRQLFAMLKQELSDSYFDQIERHLRKLKFRGGVLISARLGPGNTGVDYVLRDPHPDRRGWIERLLTKPKGYTFYLHPRDEAGAQALSRFRDQGVNLVANALAQSTDHVLSFFQMLRTELAFYIGALNLRYKLNDLGEPTCFPQPKAGAEPAMSFSGLYDVSLALSANHSVVGNDLSAEGKSLIVITGANTGGKSTFLRSVGLGQLLMQAGLFVPADGFAAELRTGLFTHYKREEDATMESGKLDEELGRMSAIVDNLKPGSMVLFNESFAATNEREGSEIAKQITDALLERGIRAMYVTHLYEFARSAHARKLPGALFLRAERLPDGVRTFKVTEGDPLQTSYGADLYSLTFGPDLIPTKEPIAISG